MPKKTLTALAGILVSGVAIAQSFEPVSGWLKLPESRENLGNMHGDIAVSASGEVYVSVQDPDAGVQVFAPDGRFLRVLANAPSDLHGFVIRDRGDGEYLYGATMRGETILKMALDGTVVMEIPASVIPEEYKTENRFTEGIGVLLTGMDVAPGGDFYVTDGYSSDYIHHFDKDGHYLESFGGKAPPYDFNTLHKLAIDERFDPPRIIATDRANNRVVHLSLEGDFLGVVAEDLKLPAAVTIAGEHAIVGELQGRVSILDRQGRVVGTVGENMEEGIGGNQLPPEQWRTGYVVAPHGVATNAHGDLFVAEFNTFGRVHKFARVVQGALPADIHPVTLSRIPPITPEDLDEEGQRLLAARADFRPGPGPTHVTIYSPRERDLGIPTGETSPVGARYFQLAVLIMAREIDQQYEWSAHEPAGRRQGLEPAVIDVVKYDRDVARLSDKDATLITFGRALLREHRVGSELWEKMIGHFGRQQTIQIMAIMGEYFRVGIMLNAIDQHLPPERPALLPMLDR